MADPVHQFQLTKLFTIAKVGPVEIALTNSGVYMIAAVTVICAFLIASTPGRALVPGRLQSVSEVLYEFVADMIRGATGPEGMQFFPLKVFAGFVTMLGAAGLLGWLGATLPRALTIALTALELLVAALQAYVFAILTCIYLNDALHPGH
jgi:F-type H+-transporting ATPase subunit a